MTGQRPPIRDPGETAFDVRLRDLHAAAVDAVSPRTLARLARGRRATTPVRTRHARPVWPWATALGSACVLVVAVHLHLQPPRAAAPAPTPVAVSEPMPSDPAAILAETPDFYVWLATTDSLTTTE